MNEQKLAPQPLCVTLKKLALELHRPCKSCKRRSACPTLISSQGLGPGVGPFLFGDFLKDKLHFKRGFGSPHLDRLARHRPRDSHLKCKHERASELLRIRKCHSVKSTFGKIRILIQLEINLYP